MGASTMKISSASILPPSIINVKQRYGTGRRAGLPDEPAGI
jgi:hypothetical protein